MEAADPYVGIREKNGNGAPPIGKTMNESEKVSAVLPTDLHTRLVERAREEDRSVSAQLRVAVREHVRNEPANAQRHPTTKEAR